jgi:acetyltransferase-like isoleucine patch superfamily enzyme
MQTLKDISNNLDFLAANLIPNFLGVLWVALRNRCVVSFKTRILFPGKLRVGALTVIRGNSVIVARSSRKAGITIGKCCLLQSFISLHSRGDFIEIGDRVGINSFCYIDGHGGVTIGNDVQFGPGVKLASNHLIPPRGETISAQPMEKKGIRIGDDVWIGANAVILDGVTIGKGCVIGANAVVNKDIPEYSVAVGVPAKVIRQR